MRHRPGMSSESSRIDILQGSILASFWEIENFDKRRKEYKKLGWIYAARNPSFVDPVFKVGESSRPPFARIEELSASTSVYSAFELAYFVHVSRRGDAEKWAHDALKEFRVNPRKGIFPSASVRSSEGVGQGGRDVSSSTWENAACRLLATAPAVALGVVSTLWCGEPGSRRFGANQDLLRGVQERDRD